MSGDTKQITPLSPYVLEKLARRVHAAQLEACAKLALGDGTAFDIPYELLDENTKELNRSAVKAVALYFQEESRTANDRAFKAQAEWAKSAQLALHYKEALIDTTAQLRALREVLASQSSTATKCESCPSFGSHGCAFPHNDLCENEDTEISILPVSR